MEAKRLSGAFIARARNSIETAYEDWQVGIFVRRARRSDHYIPSATRDVLNSQAGGWMGGVGGALVGLGWQAANDTASNLSVNPPSGSLHPAKLLPETTLHWGTVGEIGLIGAAVGLILDNAYSWWVGRRERREFSDS